MIMAENKCHHRFGIGCTAPTNVTACSMENGGSSSALITLTGVETAAIFRTVAMRAY